MYCLKQFVSGTPQLLFHLPVRRYHSQTPGNTAVADPACTAVAVAVAADAAVAAAVAAAAAAAAERS